MKVLGAENQHLDLSYESVIMAQRPRKAKKLRAQKEEPRERKSLLRIPVCQANICFLITVPVHRNEPTVCHGALYSQCFVCLHAPRGNPSQRHCILLWLPQGLRHGELFRWMRTRAKRKAIKRMSDAVYWSEGGRHLAKLCCATKPLFILKRPQGFV